MLYPNRKPTRATVDVAADGKTKAEADSESDESIVAGSESETSSKQTP